MIASPHPLPALGSLHRLAQAVPAALAVAALVALRAAGLHEGLLYPDGYQYLLMARGIAEHLEPVTALGPGGESLAPNADAAAKPLFPLLVALLDLIGVSPLTAARAVTVAAAASIPALTALVARRLGAGAPGAVLAGLLAAASPAAAFWFGFAGPDPLAPALALAAALALLARRPVGGGILAGLCALTRPEYLLVATAAALAALAARAHRREAIRAAGAGIVTASVVVALLRPPVHAPGLEAPLAAAAVVLLSAAVLAGARRVGAAALAGLSAAVAAAALVADGRAWASWARYDWALAGLALAGLALAARRPESRTAVIRILALSLPLAAAYLVKNPGLERYVVQLVPALAVVAGLGVGTLVMARLAAATAALMTLAAALFAPSRSVGVDAFRELAPSLSRAPAGTLVTAAPDAYTVLLPERTIEPMRPGATGLVVLDGAARALEPDLRAEGAVVARIPVITGFLRPDGDLDLRPALLVRGRVVRSP